MSSAQLIIDINWYTSMIVNRDFKLAQLFTCMHFQNFYCRTVLSEFTETAGEDYQR